jgi:NAD(P)H-dependent FMN reductase
VLEVPARHFAGGHFGTSPRLSDSYLECVDNGPFLAQSKAFFSSLIHLSARSKPMIKLAVILGSTRPERNGEAVAHWFYEIAKKRKDAEFEFIDLRDVNLPLLDEPVPPSMGQYSKPHTKAWSEKIKGFDGFVFVTPEYNHGICGALKNALDFLYAEWNNKAAGFVGYGSAGGVRAVEQLRLVMGELQIADVRGQVMLSLYTDFENMSHFKPAAHHEKSANNMLDQLVAWSGALKTLREK